MVSDFTADGKSDLAVMSQSSDNVSVFIGNGNGTFTPAGNYRVGVKAFGLAVADFNSDGKPDVAATNSTSHEVSILINRSTCTPSRRRSVRR
ncbi:MAG TPA: VCBS repeat-containing protein [Thermoanaerobaculia bacterium]|jgi:hypothetical protein